MSDLTPIALAIPGMLNDAASGFLNSPNNLFVGGRTMAEGVRTDNLYMFSVGLMRGSVGLLDMAGGLSVGKGTLSANAAASAYVDNLTYVKAPNGANSSAATLPEGLAYRADLPNHLAGPDGFTKSGKLSGTHNLNNATASLDGVNGTYTLTPSSTSGISEFSYEYVKPVSGKTIFGTKTVYDPAVFSDQTILDLSQQAGQNGFAKYLQDPLLQTFDSTHGGINFRTYINFDPKTGAPYVGNVHPIK